MYCKLALVAGMALWASACGWTGAPKRSPAPSAPPPPLSTIGAAITIPQNEIVTVLDGLTADHLVDLHGQPVKCGIGRCRLSLLARRTGPIAVGGAGDTLELRLPFTAHAEIAAPGFLSMLHAKGDGEGEAITRTRLAIGPDWRLHSTTLGTVRLARGILRLGPLTLDIADLWNENREKFSAPFWRAVDRQIAAVPVRPQIAKAWAGLFRPVRVGKAPPAWLVLRPERLRVALPEVGKDKVTVSLELGVRGTVVTADEPPLNPATPLPVPGRLGAPSDKFAVAVPVLLSYGQAARLAMASLRKRPPHIAGAALEFSALEILPSGTDVVVAAHFCVRPDWRPLHWLSPCGTGYLRGVPRFDAARRTIRIGDIHYSVSDGGAILVALWMLDGDVVRRMLERALVFDETRPIARLERQIAQSLATPQGDTVQIAADITSFGAPTFTWTDKGFLALFSASGKTRTKLNL